jgi:hypothetical protein
LLILLLLAACDRAEPAETPTPGSRAQNTPVQPTAESPAPTQEQPTETPGETAVPPTALPTAEPAANLPPSTLFDVAWQDRSPFRPGLIDSEAGVLEQLPGATIYHMDLVLSEDMTSISGRQEIRYTNQEDVPLDAVHYHLYPNLLGGRIDVSAVTVNQQPVSAELLNQDSILRVPLESPLPPGGQGIVQLEFLVDVPTEGGSNYGVFATINGVAALAHFYPQVGVYDAEGWDTDIPSENADVTYSDAAFYLVRLAAPASQRLMTSGVITDSRSEGGSQILIIASGPTRDFYIAGSENYIVASAAIGQTTVKSYGFAEFTERVEQALDYAVSALESFNTRFGVYPFTEFEIGPTPNLALGVEYPGVVVLNSRIYDPAESFGSTPSGFYLEGTTVHEVAHQWWYSIVGNDQPNAPWIDESLTQYSTYLYFVDQYGESGAEGYRQSFVTRWNVLEQADIPIGLPAGDYEGSAYSAIVYGRGPLFFEALSDTIGEATFNEFIMDYYATYQWGIVTGPELKALAEQHCACDLTPLFDAWVGEL